MLFAFSAVNMNATVSVLGNPLSNGTTYNSDNLSTIQSGSLVISDNGEDITFDNLKFVDESGGTSNAILIQGSNVTVTLIGENSISTKCGTGLFLHTNNVNDICHYLFKGGSLSIESKNNGFKYQANTIIDLEDMKYESKCNSAIGYDMYSYAFINCNNIVSETGWNNVGYLNIKNSTVIGHQNADKYGIKINKLELVNSMMVEPLGNVYIAHDPEYQDGYHLYCNGEIPPYFVIRPCSEMTVTEKGMEGDINKDNSVNTGDVSALYQLILNQ